MNKKMLIFVGMGITAIALIYATVAVWKEANPTISGKTETYISEMEEKLLIAAAERLEKEGDYYNQNESYRKGAVKFGVAANKFSEAGLHKRAAEVFRKEGDAWKKNKDPVNWEDSYLNAAEAYALEGNAWMKAKKPENAAKAFENERDAWTLAGMSSSYPAKALAAEGDAWKEAKNPMKAAVAYDKAGDNYKEANIPGIAKDAYLNAAEEFHSYGDSSKAEEMRQKATNTKEAAELLIEKADRMVREGDATNNPLEASDKFFSAGELYEEAGESINTALTYGKLAEMEVKFQDYYKAARAYAKQAAAWKKAKKSEKAAVAFENEGYAWKNSNFSERAVKAYAAAVVEFHSYGDSLKVEEIRQKIKDILETKAKIIEQAEEMVNEGNALNKQQAYEKAAEKFFEAGNKFMREAESDSAAKAFEKAGDNYKEAKIPNLAQDMYINAKALFMRYEECKW